MRNLNKRYILPLFIYFPLLFTSCKKDFLDVEPKGYLIAKSTDDYQQLLNTTTINAGNSAGFLGDEVAAQTDFFSAAAAVTRQWLFQYNDQTVVQGDLPDIGYLKANYSYNVVINEVMNSTNGTDAQKEDILAQAKVGRALVHLLFVNDFAMPYNTSTAAQDLGVPIISTADITMTNLKRATVQEVYDFIIKDLTEAIPNLTSSYNTNYKVSKAGAEGALGRVYLYMHDYANALKYVNAALKDAASYSGVAMYNYNQVLGTGGAWLPVSYFGPSGMPSLKNNTEGLLSVTLTTFDLGSSGAFVTTPEVGKLYAASDLRLKLYANSDIFQTTTYPDHMLRYTSFFNQVGITLPDLYLMRAELEVRDNNLTSAKADVETLRKNRMPAEVATVPSAIANDPDSLMHFIFDERKREFALNGMRWWDMRRLYNDAKYSNMIKYTHAIYNADGDVEQTFKLKPERFALKFGDKILSQNPGLVENP